MAIRVGRNLRKRREELGIKQEVFAQLVGKKRPYISRVENGKGGMPSLQFLQMAARCLKVDVSYLMGESTKNSVTNMVREKMAVYDAKHKKLKDELRRLLDML